MSKKMLVDASHPEETRVVVVDGKRVEEFDYESASRQQLKGNIYLAKVTRVEPSLQACFVEYGGNRHGFLAFSEIHPDYYQIPTADRQALIEATRASDRRADDDEGEDAPSDDSNLAETTVTLAADAASSDDHTTMSPSEPTASDGEATDADDSIVEVAAEQTDDVWVHDPEDEEESGEESSDGDAASAELSATDAAAPDEVTVSEFTADPDTDSDAVVTPETVAPGEIAEAAAAAEPEATGDDAMEELPRRDYRALRRYKIQEVIKRRQVLLVQVVKEERGNKGAALTTYLSLAGRYCVLMPNTDRGGGISRKISNVADRRKLKEMASELEVPEGMGVIIRTAGANRTKQEIKRDFEYLMRQWDAVRELTLRSSAPTVVYEEGNLIKRAIRDLYTKDVGEILVEGEHGYQDAHEFMQMLMPSHADAVRQYHDRLPLFQAYGVEAALDSMFNPIVRLRSGGYIVINQTEALVAVDVNSGKATREHHIEDTALKTNLEAAEEIARQLRLRDLAGLIVIDFIDMEENRNNRAVEKRLKDCLRFDRARIQLGRISPFGLLEMSRQRLRAGMIEGATLPCPHCEGRGVIRSVGSMALRVLRAVEEFCQREKSPAITLRLPPEIAIYILNHKRVQLTAIEDRYGAYVYIESKPSLTASTYEIERGANVPFEPRKPAPAAVTVESALEANDDVAEEGADEESASTESSVEEVADSEQTSPQRDGERRGRRRRRRGGRDRYREDRQPQPSEATPPGFGPQPVVDFNSDLSSDAIAQSANGKDADEGDEGAEFAPNEQAQNGDGDGDPQNRRRRRRGRRGRRGRRFEGEQSQHGPGEAQARSPLGSLPTPADALEAPDWPASGGFDTTPGERPQVHVPPRAVDVMEAEPAKPVTQPRAETPALEPKPERSSIAAFFGFTPKPQPEGEGAETKPARRGWWQRDADK
ncbi:MAG: Rne/Rng family ribonuclease [Alphaproteobacteria bacterium]|nr:Rne/Rng family ribonuclease [Alphaproteobacteria bacterium]